MTATDADRPSTVRPEPPVGEGNEAFWDATRRKELLYQWCRTCSAPVWFPREVCPGCLGSDLEWRPSSGQGTVYAFSFVHRSQIPNFVLPAPYAVALVELAEGPRLMANVVNASPEQLAVGSSVRVTWEPLSDGRHLPLFELDA